MFDNTMCRHATGKGVHFRIRINNQRIAYCMIRKNASSAFRELFRHHSPHRTALTGPDDMHAFMKRHHKIGPGKDLGDFDCSIFVYRDPFSRIVSAYKNKFIMQSGNERLFQSFQRQTGIDPNAASFSDLVQHYLKDGFAGIDAHLVPQRFHLRPARYTHAIHISSLHGQMAALLGQDIADRFFLQPVNSSTAATAEPVAGAHDLKATELRHHLASQGAMPPDASFLSADLLDRLRLLYAPDLEMIETLSGQSSVQT